MSARVSVSLGRRARGFRGRVSGAGAGPRRGEWRGAAARAAVRATRRRAGELRCAGACRRRCGGGLHLGVCLHAGGEDRQGAHAELLLLLLLPLVHAHGLRLRRHGGCARGPRALLLRGVGAAALPGAAAPLHCAAARCAAPLPAGKGGCALGEL